jgi:Virulence activator alpha C-term
VYTLTPAGEAALSDWLEPERDPPFEVRDEGMLRLFFSDLGPPEQRIQNLRAMREAHLRTLAQLEALGGDKSHDMPIGPHLTLELGIGLHKWIVEWCEDAERRLLSDAKELNHAD